MANFGEVRVHEKSPSGMYGWGNIDVWREGSVIRVTGTTNFRIASSSYYGYHYAAAIYWKGSEYTYWAIKDNNNGGSGQSYSKDFNVSINDNSSGRLELWYLCCGAGNGDGSLNNRNTCNATPVTTPHYVIYSIDVASGYSPPSIWLNPNDNTKIGRVDVTDYAVHYSMYKGTDNITASLVSVHNYNDSGWHPIMEKDFGRRYSSDEYWDTYKLTSDKFSNGSRYKIKMIVYDGTTYVLSPEGWSGNTGVDIYTYQKPTINTGLSCTSNQNATKANTFSISGINNRAWSSYENEFQTRYRIKRGSAEYTGWTNLGNITSWSRTAAQMRELVPKSYDNQNCIIQMKRYSPSSNWYSDNTAQATIKVSYRPQVGVTTANTSYNKNNNSGNNISKGQHINNDSTLTHIYVSWTYNTDIYEAGYTQGYRIRLYNANNQVVKTYYTANKYYQIPKADIPKIQNTYIDITPYFKNDTDNTSNYWYYDGTIAKSDFVYLISKLDTPVITYPTQNCDWINNKFRICFQLPNDPDKGSEQETYHYEDIEVQINGSYTIRMKDSTQHTTTGTNAIATQCYSSLQSDLTYQKKIVVAPCLWSSFPNASTYNIKIRVKKKYEDGNAALMWSDWSAVRTIKITTPVYNVNVGDKILANHYNNAKSTINRARLSYNVTWTLPADVVALSTKILQSQYTYNLIYKAIVDIKKQVNNYATFDSSKQAVKFDVVNSLTENFTPVEELVTAQANENNSPNGRNYMKIIYDRLNLLI